MIFASFDYGFNWTVTDSTGKEVAHFSTGAGIYVEKEVGGTPPYQVKVNLPNKEGTWIKGGLSQNAILGVMRGEDNPLISSADPADLILAQE